MSTLDGNQIDADNPLAVAVIAGGSTAHTLDGNLIDEDHPLAVAVVSGGGGSMTAPEIAAAGGMAVVAYKSADEAVNNSDVLQDDDELFFAVGANEVWSIHTVLLLSDVAGAAYRFGWSGPVGAELPWAGVDLNGVSWSPSATDPGIGDTGSVTSGLNNTGIAIIEAVYRGDVTAGTLQLRWAQDSATVGDTKVLAGSHILASRLA